MRASCYESGGVLIVWTVFKRRQSTSAYPTSYRGELGMDEQCAHVRTKNVRTSYVTIFKPMCARLFAADLDICVS